MCNTSIMDLLHCVYYLTKYSKRCHLGKTFGILNDFVQRPVFRVFQYNEVFRIINSFIIIVWVNKWIGKSNGLNDTVKPTQFLCHQFVFFFEERIVFGVYVSFSCLQCINLISHNISCLKYVILASFCYLRLKNKIIIHF